MDNYPMFFFFVDRTICVIYRDQIHNIYIIFNKNPRMILIPGLRIKNFCICVKNKNDPQ